MQIHHALKCGRSQSKFKAATLGELALENVRHLEGRGTTDAQRAMDLSPAWTCRRCSRLQSGFHAKDSIIAHVQKEYDSTFHRSIRSQLSRRFTFVGIMSRRRDGTTSISIHHATPPAGTILHLSTWCLQT